MNWKPIAITFIIICTLETSVLLWAWNIGGEMIEEEEKAFEKKMECYYNVCEMENILPSEYDAFYYDSYYGKCYCFKDKKIIFEKYIG